MSSLGFSTLVVVAIWCFVTFVSNVASRVHVSPTTNSFIDSEGYTRIFHGGSQVNKDVAVGQLANGNDNLFPHSMDCGVHVQSHSLMRIELSIE